MLKNILKRAGLVSLALVLLITSVLFGLLNGDGGQSVSAAPGVGQEAGIWINKYEIVIYNNVLRNGKSTETLSDGKAYDVWSAGEVFTNTDFKSGEAKQDFILDTENRLPIGDTYSNERGCATISFGAGRTSGTLTGSCGGQTISTRITMERSELSDTDAYLNGDEIFMPLFVGKVEGIPNNPEEGSDVNGILKFDGTFNKTDGDNASNSGYAKREFTNCEDGECYGLSGGGKPGNQDNTWIRVTGTGDNPEIAQARRQSSSGTCKGDCSATVVVKAKAARNKSYDIDQQIEATQRFQNSEAKRNAFRDFFSDTTNQDKAKFCASTLTRGFSVEYTIDTLVNPIPGPYLDCLKKAFQDDDDFNTIDSIEGVPASAPEHINEVDDSDCGSGAGSIPIITDLACSITKWLFNTIFEIFTGVINWLASPPDMFKEQNSTLEQSMSNLRNIANVLFVLAFLMVIFQYLTNINVADAYFIKKFVPRLVIAVILVQASFWITAELNYFFYDLGRSVQSIVFFGQQPGELQLGNGAATIAAFAGPGILGMALVIGLVMLIVLLITLVVLAIRYILIIVLAIFAPLAFAAFAIPQLESMTKKWFKMYVQLLMMYPIIMFFIAASSIVGGVFSGGGTIVQLMGLIVQLLPFIVLPFTFKFAGGMMGNISGKIMSTAKKQAVSKGKQAYGGSQFGMRRAKEKEFKKGIKADRASNAASDRLTKKMKGTMSPYARTRMFGAGATGQEVDKYRGVFEDKENKRKSEEASAALSTKLKGTNDREGAVKLLNDEFHGAASRGDSHAMSAAYAQLVKQQATPELEAIQEQANTGAIDTGTYNRLQGDNYGDLKAFAPHLTGDVGTDPSTGAPKDLHAMHAQNMSGMSNDQLAGVKPEAWAAWAKADPNGAAARRSSIESLGGGAAAKLSPDAISKMLTAASHSDMPGGFDKVVTASGGINSISTNDLKKSYESLTKKINNPEPSATPDQTTNARDAATKILNELSGRP